MDRKTAVFVRVDLKNEIKILAAQKGITIQAVVETALESLLGKNKKNNAEGT